MEDTDQASTLRAEGNSFYKNKEITKAIEKYKQCAELVPNDPVPLGNLSAAQYEIGQYEECVKTAEQALSMLDLNADESSATIGKLAQRIDRANTHLQHASCTEQARRRNQILTAVPRYRPCMLDLEYYTFGHDIAVSLFEPKLASEGREGEHVAFFLGGIGDARHMFRTMIDIAAYEKKANSRKRKYHFTVVDVNKCALARDLVIMLLLDDLSKLKTGSDEALATMTTIFYVYISVMMPRFAYRQLSETIDRVLKMIQAGKQPLSWAFIREADRQPLAKALKSWQGSALNVFSSQKAIELVIRQQESFLFELPPGFAGPDIPAFCKKEQVHYRRSAFLIPPKRILEIHDSSLLALLQSHGNKPREHASKFKKHLEEHWNANTTLVDVEWHASLSDKDSYDIGNNPFDSLAAFTDSKLPKPHNPSRLFDLFYPFWQGVSGAIEQLRGRVQVEVVYGDLVDTAERLRFGLYREPDAPADVDVAVGGNTRRATFPVLFDKIHLSNVPDYIGGHLSTFLYAAPLLKFAKTSTVESVCLRNSGTWSSLEHFLAEYQMITDRSMLKKLTRIEVTALGSFPWPMADYTKYRLCGDELSQPFSELLPQSTFNKWFYGLFFRLALPFNQELRNFRGIVVSMLNLTVIFRMLFHLHTLGYPSHWLSANLTMILENQVISTCRPPRKPVASVNDVKQDHPARKLCTKPFSHEMAVLARIFEPLLPFTLNSSSIPVSEDVFEYTFALPDVRKPEDPSAFLALVFWDDDYLSPIGETAFEDLYRDIRPLFDPTHGDEVDRHFKGTKYDNLREKGLILWSTLSWDGKKKSVTAWMSKKFVDMMVKKGFLCNLYRTDIWQAVCTSIPKPVSAYAKKGRSWEGTISLQKK